MNGGMDRAVESHQAEIADVRTCDTGETSQTRIRHGSHICLLTVVRFLSGINHHNTARFLDLMRHPTDYRCMHDMFPEEVYFTTQHLALQACHPLRSKALSLLRSNT
jgi:hypothetical protein